MNNCILGDTNMVYSPDYSSRVMFFGGFTIVPGSIQNQFFNKSTTADEIYQKTIEGFASRWDQIYKASGGK